MANVFESWWMILVRFITTSKYTIIFILLIMCNTVGIYSSSSLAEENSSCYKDKKYTCYAGYHLWIIFVPKLTIPLHCMLSQQPKYWNEIAEKVFVQGILYWLRRSDIHLQNTIDIFTHAQNITCTHRETVHSILVCTLYIAACNTISMELDTILIQLNLLSILVASWWLSAALIAIANTLT